MEHPVPPTSAAEYNARPYVKHYKEFWQNIVEVDGQLSKDAVMRELHDFNNVLNNVPKVYAHITDSVLSKANYDADIVISEADDVLNKHLREELTEIRQGLLEEIDAYAASGNTIPPDELRTLINMYVK